MLDRASLMFGLGSSIILFGVWEMVGLSLFGGIIGSQVLINLLILLIVIILRILWRNASLTM